MVLKKYDFDLRNTFYNLWYFEFNEKKDLIGQGLMTHNVNKYEILKKRFNINYQIYENTNRNKDINLKNFGEYTQLDKYKINNIIKSNLENKNIIICEVDTFKYKYDKGFQKYYGVHSCIIQDIIGPKAIILDVWYNLFDAEIEYEDLLNAITRIVVLDMSEIEENKIEKLEVKNYILTDQSIIEMKNFFMSIDNLNLNKEYMQLDFDIIFKAPIDKALRKIVMNRQRFANYLYYISEKFNDSAIKIKGDCMFIISMDWTRLRNILLQTYFLKRKLNIEQIKKITSNILIKELQLKKEIEELK